MSSDNRCNWNHGYRKCFKKRRAKVLGLSAPAEIKRTACLRRKKFLIGDWRWSICRLRFLSLWFSTVVISYIAIENKNWFLLKFHVPPPLPTSRLARLWTLQYVHLFVEWILWILLSREKWLKEIKKNPYQ